MTKNSLRASKYVMWTQQNPQFNCLWKICIFFCRSNFISDENLYLWQNKPSSSRSDTGWGSNKFFFFSNDILSQNKERRNIDFYITNSKTDYLKNINKKETTLNTSLIRSINHNFREKDSTRKFSDQNVAFIVMSFLRDKSSFPRNE